MTTQTKNFKALWLLVVSNYHNLGAVWLHKRHARQTYAIDQANVFTQRQLPYQKVHNACAYPMAHNISVPP